MKNFIETVDGEFVAISVVAFAEQHENDQLLLHTPSGQFVVKKSDFLKIVDTEKTEGK